MVEAIVKDTHDILPCAVKTQGKYGLDPDLFVGLPAKLGRKGVEEVIEFELTDEELNALKASADHVRQLCNRIEELKLL